VGLFEGWAGRGVVDGGATARCHPHHHDLCIGASMHPLQDRLAKKMRTMNREFEHGTH
jgi:hypothetical protein